ncbi:hypothetical protein OUZ56_005417 [Daphnia magna]|uniref:PHD-type domain-containing protein n=1 Tax=Daphnia magna TaxID=35525 RepID=A0ABQ9YSU5_9CRUS|nr:hypothetical protein OUZ56_005417 [Daphnia magna]
MADYGDRRQLPPKYRVMVQCTACKNYHHQECAEIPQTTINSIKIPWFCMSCKIVTVPITDLYPVRPVTAGAEGQSGLTGVSLPDCFTSTRATVYESAVARWKDNSCRLIGLWLLESGNCLSPFRRLTPQESYSYCGYEWLRVLAARSQAGTVERRLAG